MLQILLVRPGATDYDRQGRIQGTLNIPLSEDGRQEVEALVDELRPQAVDAIYTSPCQAAQETAEAIAAERDLKPKTIDALHNLDHGLWQGMLVADVKAKQPKVYRQWHDQPETVCPPQGETVCSAKQRVQTVIAKLVKKHKSAGLVVLAVPEPLASVVRHVLRHDPLADLWQRPERPTNWDLIEILPEPAAAK